MLSWFFELNFIMNFYAILFYIIGQFALSMSLAFDKTVMAISLLTTLAFILIDEVVSALREIAKEIKESRESKL